MDPRLPTLVGLGFASVLGPTRGGVAGVAARPLLKFRGGHPPQPPAMGASPPWTLLLPAPVGLGFAVFWVPLLAGVQELATRPLFENFGGTSPKPPGRGLRPLHPRFNQGRRRPTFFKEADFSRRGGTPLTAPRQGGFAPWIPRLPTLVGLGFAGVLGPTRGGVTRVSCFPLLWKFWGHIPQTPGRGMRPLHPRFNSLGVQL